MCRAAWIAIGVALCSSSIVVAQEATVDQIKASWWQTMQRTPACRFEWTETRNSSKNSSVTSRFTLLLRNKDDFRLDRANQRFDRAQERDVTDTYTSTWNGIEGRSFFGRDSFTDDLHPVGFISTDAIDWDTYQVLPLLLAVRPLNSHFSPISAQEYFVRPEVTERDGRVLLELAPQGPAGSQSSDYIYFVDPARDFSVSRITRYWQGKQLWQIDIEHARDESVNTWIPQSWKLVDQSYQEERTVSQVNAFFGEAIADEQFRYQFPFGTLVSDRTGDHSELFIALNDQGRLVIPQEARHKKIPYLEYLTKARLADHEDVN